MFIYFYLAYVRRFLNHTIVCFWSFLASLAHAVAATVLRCLEPPKVRGEPTTLRVTAIIEFSPLD